MKKIIAARQDATRRAPWRSVAGPVEAKILRVGTAEVWHKESKIGDAITASPTRTTATHLARLNQKNKIPPTATSFCVAEFPSHASALVTMPSKTNVTLFVRLQYAPATADLLRLTKHPGTNPVGGQTLCSNGLSSSASLRSYMPK